MNLLKLTNRFPSVFANPFVSTSRRGLWRSLIWIVSKIVAWHYPFCTVILSQGKGYCVTVIGGILVRLKKLENYISAELGWNICYILSCHLKISELLTVCFHEKRISHFHDYLNEKSKQTMLVVIGYKKKSENLEFVFGFRENMWWAARLA